MMSLYQQPTRIIIADDHEAYREGFKILFKSQPDIELIAEAANGQELIEQVGEHHPDVLLVDIKMPVLDGIEATRIIRTQYPQIQVIAISSFNDDNLIIDMLEAGAIGYLLKNTTREELLRAVMAVKQGKQYYSSETSQKLTRLIGSSNYNPYRKYPTVKFSGRELEIIQLICQEYTSKQIGAKLGLSFRTVDSYRETIQEKIGAKNSIGIVVYAIKKKLFVPESL